MCRTPAVRRHLACLAVSMAAGLATSAHAADLWSTLAPLAPQGRLSSQGDESHVERVTIDPVALSRLASFNEAPGVVLPIGPGQTVMTTLSRVTITDPAAKIVVMTDAGEQPAAPTIQLWRGTVDGFPNSTVFLGIADEQAHAIISMGTEPGAAQYLITTAEVAPGDRATLAYNAASVQGHLSTPFCNGALRPPGRFPMMPTGLVNPLGTDGTTCRSFPIAIETDNEFRAALPSTTAAVNYATFLIASVSEIYNRELGAGLNLVFLRIWDTPDPWSAVNTSGQLGELRSYWLANQTSTQRATVHMLSQRPLGGGIAYIQSLCDDFAFGVSANLNMSFPYPITNNASGNSNWDPMVVAHELGHNFGTGHTHCNAEFAPIIDGCGLRASGPACEIGTQDCSVATAQQGTIMSYCHTCFGGVSNMRMEFGPRVVARIQSFLTPLPNCGTTSTAPVVGSMVATSNPACIGRTLTITANVSSPAGSAVTYQWYLNGSPIAGAISSQYVIPSVSTGSAGTYRVLVRNACGIANPASSTINITTTPNCTTGCYANCDGSTMAPVLGAADFSCFLDRYRAGHAYANCNNSTAIPILGPADFSCFLTKFRAGC